MPELKIKDDSPHCSKHVLPLVVGGLTITCEDNMDLMKRYPDKYFDLAIVDPPYGINFAETIEKNSWNRNLKNKYLSKKWDASIPSKEYFDELFRVSKNQIVWGGNYFLEFLPSSPCFIIWFKSQGFTGADCEIAWTSFKSPSRSFKMSRIEAHCNENKIHPTQKNIKIYKWILDKYAKQGDKILDTHLGSGSIAIACHDYKFELTACELDEEYFNKAKQRIINHVAQQSLF
jgi:site-specific DNA-methyltransferase (adenine-specific)